MIARTPPPTTTLPASLILTPRELKQYRRFQAQTTLLKPKDQGLLPSAAEYADFQSWLAKRDSGYLSDTPLADIASYLERATGTKEEHGKASICGHALHPSLQEKMERCPVCIVDMHRTYMKVLTVALEDAGGMVKQRWEAADRDSPTLQAWYAGKLALIRDIHWLESLAQDEQEHDEQHHHQPPRCSGDNTVDVKTAIQAIQLYWDSIEASPTVSCSPQKKPARNVVFRPETSFEPGRDQHYFWRKSPRYEAGGKYASSSDCDQEDPDEEVLELQGSEDNCQSAVVTKVTTARVQSGDEEDQCDDNARVQEDDEDDWEDEDESEEDEEDDEDDDDDDDCDDDDTHTDYIVFEYEEVAIEGADFIVFEA